MQAESRAVHYDSDLNIEAYHFKGIMQRFPNHFHEHYVIGYVEAGRRRLACKGREYSVGAGDLLLFNPHDAHACEQIGGEPLDWRCLNIKEDAMRKLAEEITGKACRPAFAVTVAARSEAVPALRDLHESIMTGARAFDKEENLYFLIERLLASYAQPSGGPSPQGGREIQAACAYMERHYTENIALEDLARVSGRGKFALLRAFTVEKGITPYQYLSTIRINHAKSLMEAGTAPIDAAMQTGFADQSHFTRFFKTFIGLTPGAYRDLFQGEAK